MKVGFDKLLEGQCCSAKLRFPLNIAGLSVHMNNKVFSIFPLPANENIFEVFIGIKQNNYSTDTTIQQV
jgi:hypothetical protein